MTDPIVSFVDSLLPSLMDFAVCQLVRSGGKAASEAVKSGEEVPAKLTCCRVAGCVTFGSL